MPTEVDFCVDLDVDLDVNLDDDFWDDFCDFEELFLVAVSVVSIFSTVIFVFNLLNIFPHYSGCNRDTQ